MVKGKVATMKQLITILLVLLPISGIAQTTWDVSLWGQRRAFTEHIEKLAELVEAKTNGEFRLNLSYGELAPPRDNLGGIANGTFEMAQICAGLHIDKTPSLTVLELPYLGVSTLEEERIIGQHLLRQPAVLRDLQQYNAIALMPTPLPQQNLVGSGESPKTLSDLAGLRVRATTGTAQAMEALGALPTLVTASKVRDALETNQINAAAFAPHEHMSFGTIANATWWTENLNPGTINCPIIANTNSIEELPPQYREALYNSINESLDYYVRNYEYNLSQSWEPVLQELNVEKVYFSQSEMEAFRIEVAASAAQRWIEENTARGVDAQTLFESVITELYGGNPADIPEAFPVFSEEKKKQQIIDNYAFNRVPAEVQKPLPQAEPVRTFAFNKKQTAPQQESLPIAATIPIADTIPIEAPKSNTRIENIADVTVAALPASAAGPMFFTNRSNTASAEESLPGKKTTAKELPPLVLTLPIEAPKSNTRIENIADVTVAALPASAAGPMFFGTNSKDTSNETNAADEQPQKLVSNLPAPENYFGLPRNETAKILTANPMEMTVEWDLDSNATVGETLQKLAQYIGYRLVDNDIGLSVLTRKLPAVHRKVESITVADGFKVISGRGLLTVFNHVDRTVRHLQQKSNITEKLSACPDDITLASFSREGVLKLSDGSECLFQ